MFLGKTGNYTYYAMGDDTNNRKRRSGDKLKFKENDTTGVSIEFSNNNKDYKYVLRSLMNGKQLIDKDKNFNELKNGASVIFAMEVLFDWYNELGPTFETFIQQKTVSF